MKTKILYIIFFISFSLLTSFPIKDFDFHKSGSFLSPVMASLGGHHPTYTNDTFITYYNACAPAGMEISNFGFGYKLDTSSGNNNIASGVTSILHRKKISFVGFASKEGGLLYHPIIDLHKKENYEIEGKKYNEYTDYYVNSFNISMIEETEEFNFGLTLKYLHGRLVYLKEYQDSLSWIKEDFIDSNARGFSADFGTTYTQGNMSYGLSFYDFFSRLYWKGYSTKRLKSKVAVGAKWQGEFSSAYLSITQRIAIKTDRTYHLGYEYPLRFSSLMKSVRFGMMSDNFKSSDDIYYSMGSTITYKIFNFNFSLLNNGLKIDKMEYLFSISAGM